MKQTAIIFLVLIFAGTAAQQLPVRPNKTDALQKRQGDWCLWMDGHWQPTPDSSAAVFYRLITYKNNKPVGVVKDFFKNGQKQFEGLLLEDRPEDVFGGHCTWYYHTGEVRVTESFKNGEPNEDQKVLLRSGKPADENWMDHYHHGEELSDQKKYAESAKEFETAIEHVEAFLGRESEDYANIADWLGIVYNLSDNDLKAIHYKEEFVAVRKLIHSQPDTLLLSNLAGLGVDYKRQKTWPMAKRKLKEFLDLNSRYFNAGHPEYPEVLQTLGTVCEALHEYDDALAYLTEAGKFFYANPAKYEYSMLSNIFSLPGLYLSMGEMVKGEQFLSEKIKMIKSKYGVKSEYYITAIGLLARLHYGAGQLKLAEQEWMEQLNLVKSVNGEQSEEFASTLGSLAELNVVLGDVPKADQYIQQARKIYERLDSGEEYYLLFLEKLSIIYGLMGNQTGLLQTIQKRSELTIKLFGKNSIQYSQVLLAMAQTVFFEKKWDQSMVLVKEAISIFSKYEFKVLDERQQRTLALLHQVLSTAYLMQYYSTLSEDKIKLAHHHAEESIRIFESQPSQATGSMMNDSYLAMAFVYEAELDKRKADYYFNLVLTKIKKEFGENNFQLIDLMFVIARKSELRKDFKQSFNYYQKAIAQQRQYVQHVFPYLSEREKEQFYERNKQVLQRFYGFAAQYHDRVPGLAEVWCNLLIEQKGFILQSFAPVRDAIYASGNKSLQQVFASWQSAKNEYASLLQNPVADQTKLSSLAEQLNDLEKQISASSISSNASFKLKGTSWRDIQKMIGPDEAAMEIVFAVEDTEGGYDSSYHAVVIKTGIAQPVIVKLKPAKEIEGRPLKFYQNAIRNQLNDLISYDTYWKPLETHLEGIKKIWLSSDGAYHQINPSTLYNPITKKYLQDEMAIQLVPSTAWILNQKKFTPLSQVTIFAHPDYGAVASASKTNLTRSLDLELISDLPGTEKELHDIASLFDQHKIVYQDFEGAEANEDEIKKVALPQVLHIATHGFFLPSVTTTEQAQNPLLRSGLLMAGCQKKPHLQNPNANDGVLTAFEVSTLPLFKTSLVVLSACETGLGDVKNGEGVYGLQRAFLMAGAGRVMMSLWKVDDQATREFMVLFYQGWITLKDISKAHQYAQNQLKEKYPHPYYWGAFVICGE